MIHSFLLDKINLCFGKSLLDIFILQKYRTFPLDYLIDHSDSLSTLAFIKALARHSHMTAHFKNKSINLDFSIFPVTHRQKSNYCKTFII